MTWKTTWPKAYPETKACGILKQQPQDFIVDEIPLFDVNALTGLDANADVGEHIYLKVKKRNANSQWVAKLIAEFCGVKESDVGYAGMKDRHGITTQWFSVYLPLRNLNGVEKILPQYLKADEIFANPELAVDEEQGSDNAELIEVLQQARHSKKIRTGDLLGNRFKLCLKQVTGDIALIEKNLEQIKTSGVPNYFGDQRFGHDYGNLDMAKEMFAGKRIRNKKKKGLYLSAARSYLFNLVVAERIEQNLWGQALVGDINIEQQAIEKSSDATAPLWGRGQLSSTDQTLALEQSVLQQLTDTVPGLVDGLEHSGLNQERRLITAQVANLTWQWQDDSLLLDFALPAGFYATSVVQEIMQVTEPLRGSER